MIKLLYAWMSQRILQKLSVVLVSLQRFEVVKGARTPEVQTPLLTPILN